MTVMRFRLALCAMIVLAAPHLAAAQTAAPPPSTDTVKSAAGAWEFSNADRDRSCTLTLRSTPAPGGLGLEWDRKCGELFPFSREITSWTVGGREAIQFLDRAGKMVLELSEVEGGLYEGERSGEGIIFMQSLGAAAAEKTAAEIAGEWAFVGAAGQPICQVSLVNTAAGPERLTLRIKPGCDAAVARFGPAAWRMDRGQLVVMPKSGERSAEPWRFEESDPTTWRRVPEGRQPSQLVRQ